MTRPIEHLEPRLVLDGAGGGPYYGDLDPFPKTISIQVLPHPDANGDGIVNGQDIAAIAARWGEEDGAQRMPIGGLHLSTIASHWLMALDPVLDTIAPAVAAAQAGAGGGGGGGTGGGGSGGGGSGGVEVHLPVIYPPLGR